MAIGASRITMNPTEATLIATGSKGVVFKNIGAYAVAVGPSGVTFSTGYIVDAGAVSPAINLGLAETLYGISTEDDTVVMLLTTTQLI